MISTNWLLDNRLQKLDSSKTSFLGNLFTKLNSLSDDDKLPFLIAIIQSETLKKISFTKEELDLILAILKDYSKEEEITLAQTLVQFLTIEKS